MHFKNLGIIKEKKMGDAEYLHIKSLRLKSSRNKEVILFNS